MESSHLVIFSTSVKFITKFNVLRCISLSEALFWTGGQGSNTNHLKDNTVVVFILSYYARQGSKRFKNLLSFLMEFFL